jgi:phospholipid/cholesterol/gamma-HCH transport system ATP-binding protein
MAVILKKQRVVLRFEETALMTETDGSAEPDELSLSVYSGELVLIRLARLEQTSTFADTCAGIIQPATGAVYFLGRNWPELPPDQANALRGRIGRVFRTANWINHLALMENILLPQLHHTRRSVRQLRDKAGELAQQFGLPGVPLDLPGDIPEADLQRAACVRAFLGRADRVRRAHRRHLPRNHIGPDECRSRGARARRRCHLADTKKSNME